MTEETGRLTGCLGFPWEDIDWERGFIRIRRGNWRTIISTAKVDRRRRTPALTDELRAVLVKWQAELFTSRPKQAGSGWIFPSRPGRPHHNSSCMRKAFLDCLQEIGVHRRFSSHGLRRTANDLIRRVASGEVARAITGHVTVAMTDHYAHVDTGEKRGRCGGNAEADPGRRRSPRALPRVTPRPVC
jgi:integrase